MRNDEIPSAHNRERMRALSRVHAELHALSQTIGKLRADLEPLVDTEKQRRLTAGEQGSLAAMQRERTRLRNEFAQLLQAFWGLKEHFGQVRALDHSYYGSVVVSQEPVLSPKA
jgi:hypothetical protein